MQNLAQNPPLKVGPNYDLTSGDFVNFPQDVRPTGISDESLLSHKVVSVRLLPLLL